MSFYRVVRDFLAFYGFGFSSSHGGIPFSIRGPRVLGIPCYHRRIPRSGVRSDDVILI